MLYFKTRAHARAFKAKQAYFKLVDNGVESPKRWGVKITR